MKDEKIFVERSEVKRLASIFGVSDEFVYMALRYARDSTDILFLYFFGMKVRKSLVKWQSVSDVPS